MANNRSDTAAPESLRVASTEQYSLEFSLERRQMEDYSPDSRRGHWKGTIADGVAVNLAFDL